MNRAGEGVYRSGTVVVLFFPNRGYPLCLGSFQMAMPVQPGYPQQPAMPSQPGFAQPMPAMGQPVMGMPQPGVSLREETQLCERSLRKKGERWIRGREKEDRGRRANEPKCTCHVALLSILLY